MDLIAPALELSALEKLREEELEEARLIQQGMFPPVTFSKGSITMAHKIQPVTEVGGDFLDYFALSDETLGLYLGDVSGKGLPAALYSALAVGTLRGVHKTGACPTMVLEVLNKRLTLRGIPYRYAAVQYALYDPQTRRMQISSAGLPGPLYVTAEGCLELYLPGIPPGVLSETRYEVSVLELKPGDSVVFFTDGITDARNHRDEFFDIERLTRICKQLYGSPPEELLDRIFAAVEEFSGGRPQHDDMTVAVFHCGQ
jgi:sigma-B regulation protein RsbU (phosphoserine phosphatase)